MKLSGITNEDKIRKELKSLYDNLSVHSDKKSSIDCGGPGGIVSIDVYFSEKNQFWWGSRIEEDSKKYWNPVGFGVPNSASLETSDCEFNCSLKGFHKTASLFAKDNKDNVYLLHSGKAGGNTPGTSIENFCKFYEGVDRQQILIEGTLRDFFIVSEINSKNLLENIIEYAKAIYDFKEDLKAKIAK